MKSYAVEVPVYVRLVLQAPSPEVAAEAAEAYVNELEGKIVRGEQHVNGLFIKEGSIELLDETDRTPDVYLRVGKREDPVPLAA